jgi:bis(5'-nucleosyl)-tetraphosphatase (symmetrical)
MKTMALYLIGDIQGCNSDLQRLLDAVDFSPSRDTIFILGDLVNRGPDSVGVLRRLMAYENSACCLLGNHDLNLLAIACGVRKPHRNDTLDCVLQAPDRIKLLHWLSQQRMAIHLKQAQGHEYLMVHAGVLPSWSAEQTMALASEVEAVLRSQSMGDFLSNMYGNTPSAWSDSLSGFKRLRVIVNALTRMRYCNAAGEMELESKEGVASAPDGYLPWFAVPGRQTAGITVAFGHWSTLGWLGCGDVLSMDTGCVWGGCLSALRIGTDSGTPVQELIQVPCKAAQRPGKSG